MNQDIKYIGQITVTIKQKDKVISQQTYHNNGKYELFRFLCDCIAGNYDSNYGPYYIRLFTFKGSEPSVDSEIISTGTTSSIPLCKGIRFNSSNVVDEEITKDGTTIENSYAYLHFTIPYTFIDASKAKSSNIIKIYQTGLYNIKNTRDGKIENYSASFNFIKDNPDTSTGGKVWDPLTISLTNDDFNIFIDWKLSFDN